MENKVPILYVMVGLPGSGKSHIAEELARANNAVVYSMDEIRGELKAWTECNCRRHKCYKTR